MLRYPLKFWYDTGFLNTYIDVSNETMHIVFNKNSIYETNFNLLKETLSYNFYYIDFTETDNNYIIQLSIPAEFKDDFYLFLDGSYSKMSEEYKQTLLGLFYTYNKAVYHLLNKTFYPKKGDIEELENKLGTKLFHKEVTSSPTLKLELFNIANFQ